MIIFVADDEKLILKYTCRILTEVMPQARIFPFHDSQSLLDQAQTLAPDIAFLDINMPVINGVDMAVKLKQLNPKVNIIFATAYDNYKSDAIDIFASGYMVKPITKFDVVRQLENLRFPVEINETRIKVKTFGVFGVYSLNKPVFFHRSKAKEMLAYLVAYRGKMIDMKLIAENVFEDAAFSPATKRLMDVNLRSLQDDLCAAGISEMLLQNSQCLGINADLLSCDLYDYCDNLPGSDELYHGRFMEPYTWAEKFNDTLLKRAE